MTRTMPTYRLAEVSDTGTATTLPLLDRLLANRGVTDQSERERFLAPDFDRDRHDPFLMHDMEKAVERILLAIDQRETIGVFADYDCDGIPGAVLLNDFFSAVGHSAVVTYIPHRNEEGFGLSVEAVDALAKKQVTLIITVDCGTSDVEAVRHANTHGIEVIITDHHEPKETLPEAFAIVNPKIGETYPWRELCGSGVAWKLIEALIERGNFSLPAGKEKWWLDMVGLATLSDMVPLQGENRLFARYGLTVLRKSRRPGIQHLLRLTKTSQQHLTEDDIGFTIAPRINAASRMDTPEDAFRMLVSTDEGEAGTHARHLEQLNNERRGVVAAMTREAHTRMRAASVIPGIIVMGDPLWRPSLVGLVANSLAEEYARPAFLWGRDGREQFKGSCRSGSEVSVITVMNAASDLFLEYGGHHASGGFTIRPDHIFTFSTRLETVFAGMADTAQVVEDTIIDAELTFADLTDEFWQTLRTLAPYGVGNPKPLFMFSGVVPTQVAVFGKGKEHLKLLFESGRGSIEALAFFKNTGSFKETPETNVPLTLIAHPEESYFGGKIQRRLRIVDII